MAQQDTATNPPTPDAHDAGVRRGESRSEPLAQRRTRMASDATGINPEDSGPIDPRMPNLPPA
jgi:hypothetical protein